MRTAQEALKIAAQLVESTAIAGKRDSVAELPENRDGFSVRYEREGLCGVTLHVDMRLVSSVTREMQIKVQLSYASEFRSPARTREFIALLTRCTELAEQIEAALGDTKFVFEVQS